MISVEKQNYLPAEIGGQNNPQLRELRERYPDNRTRIFGRAILGVYMRLFHRLNIQFDPDMPKKGPVLFYTNHDSNSTIPALIVADPCYPQTTFPVKRELFKIPIVGRVLSAWGAIPVNRDGEDKEAVFQMLRILKEGRTVCIAGEGTRSKDGVLQPMDSSFVGFALLCARRGIPIVPLVERGTYKSLPKGAWFPRPHTISVRGGKPIDLSQFVSQKIITPEVKIAAAQCLQYQLAALLPLEQRPRPGTKPMWDREEYIKPKKKS